MTDPKTSEPHSDRIRCDNCGRMMVPGDLDRRQGINTCRELELCAHEASARERSEPERPRKCTCGAVHFDGVSDGSKHIAAFDGMAITDEPSNRGGCVHCNWTGRGLLGASCPACREDTVRQDDESHSEWFHPTGNPDGRWPEHSHSVTAFDNTCARCWIEAERARIRDDFAQIANTHDGLDAIAAAWAHRFLNDDQPEGSDHA